MSCDLSKLIIHFVESGIKIRPFSLDVRLSRRSSNQFDHVQATLTKKAGEHIIENHVEREPVEIIADDSGNLLYRGWYTADAISLGESQSVLKIADPRRILTSGTIDKEWGRITLKNVVNYIFDRRIDPHNVLTGFRIDSPNIDETKLQFTRAGITNKGEERTPGDTPARTDGLQNFLLELSPISDGDGNFDFREESPYSALVEIADIWETAFWIDQDGTAVIGHPDLTTTIFPAGRGSGNWHISEWNLPENPTPLKAVVAKGKMDQKGGKDNNAEELWNVVTNKKKYQTRAAAGFLDDNSLEEVAILDGKKPTTDPTVLRKSALRAFYTYHTQNNQGSVVINAMVDNGIPAADYAGLDIGDMLFVNNYNVACNDIKEGLYVINSIQHDINGEDGWTITLEVNQAIVNGDKVKTRFWYFDPTNPDMTEEFGGNSTVSL